ncbi:hypothetical protein WMY93_025115 [Mugilogobius chulae]|uniref:Protein kinase domain-containing protein n=1 Tax=Mugilogobius chulae TaxID=88201 RepID=A0AAW0N1G9_9GOBI
MIFLLLLGFNLFPNYSEFETLKVMVKLLGQPPDHMLDEGLSTRLFFMRRAKAWTLLTDADVFSLYGYKVRSYLTERCDSFQDLMETKFGTCNQEEPRDIDLASDLLGKMLKMERADRITPSEILQHPFIRSKSEESPESILEKPAENTTPQPSLEQKEAGYEVRKMLGSGKFGQMVRCKQPDTRKIVTIKFPFSTNRTQREVRLLQRMRKEEMNQQNIITFIDTLQTSRGEILVLEKLNMNLYEYLEKHKPLDLSDVRTIVQQTATALRALKSNGLIHTGVMMENIWVCSHTREPLQIKLADFGALIRKKKAEPGMEAQLVHYRAPEIILGLPFNTAIDVWSLGCLLVTMLIGFDVFPSKTEYETLRTIIILCGPPSDDLLDVALKTNDFYTPVVGDDGQRWKIKSTKQYAKYANLPRGSLRRNEAGFYDSVEELIQARLCISEHYQPHELADCISLAKDMLAVDWTQRITPAQILEHPFISEKFEMEEPEPEEDVVQEKMPTVNTEEPLDEEDLQCERMECIKEEPDIKETELEEKTVPVQQRSLDHFQAFYPKQPSTKLLDAFMGTIA